MAEGRTIDLITVALYRVAGSQVLVPQRVDPERVPRVGPVPSVAKGTLFEGPEAFVASIEDAEEKDRAALRQLAAWAISLEREGLVGLFSYRGTSGRFTLLPRLLAEDVGLVTIWNDGGAYLSLWQSVFERGTREHGGRFEVVRSETDWAGPIGPGAEPRASRRAHRGVPRGRRPARAGARGIMSRRAISVG
jgi:hypothetical protein